MAESIREKADRLAAEGRVCLLPMARVYEVEGDTATYLVVAAPSGISCPCEARGACSHQVAVAKAYGRDFPEYAEVLLAALGSGRDPDAAVESEDAR